jgi:hypothetical protein
VIVRILGEGQFELDQGHARQLDELDSALVEAVEGDDDRAFEEALAELVAEVKRAGRALPPDYLGPSDMTVPAPGSSRLEVRSLLSDDGSVPD